MLSNPDQTRRIQLIFLWSVLTLFFVFSSLLIGIYLIGEQAGSNLIFGNIYTLLPGVMAILFILKFKTDTLENMFLQFSNPGLKWVLFGFFYTGIVLIPTIILGSLLGELSYNPNYNPFSGELEGFKTNLILLDLVLYVVIVGSLLIFSPGGFIRVIGEEVGWRGYLLPECLKVYPKMSLIFSSVIVGFVWFIYHLPYFTILAPVSGINTIFLVLGSAGVFFGANWAMMWAYLKTKNLWPALSLHFIWNLISPMITGNIYSKSLGLLNQSLDNLWLVNGEGLIGGFFHFIIGLVFLSLIVKHEPDLVSQYEEKSSTANIEVKLSKMKVR